MIQSTHTCINTCMHTRANSIIAILLPVSPGTIARGDGRRGGRAQSASDHPLRRRYWCVMQPSRKRGARCCQ